MLWYGLVIYNILYIYTVFTTGLIVCDVCGKTSTNLDHSVLYI